MTTAWTLDDLESWDERILQLVDEAGLDCFPQEFEVCDHNQMLAYMAYSGMPAHYPHWSYGKSYERQKTLYELGVSGLPYELVINSNPSLAYLMKDNTLCLQVLIIAHVYGHNDFFKNNFTFHHTRPELTLTRFKSAADRVRSYIEDPSIGIHRVEEILDAAQALAYQCRRNFALRKLDPEEQIARAEEADVPHDEWASIHPKPEPTGNDHTRLPLEPEEDVLLFIRDNNRFLEDWQRDILTIVHERTEYFLPQIETKIMNEGWASFWHHWIMNRLELSADLHLEFSVHHAQVLRPIPGQINPYYLGFKVWHDIVEKNGGLDSPDAMAEIFKVREVDRDVSFLRRFLGPELMRDLDMFEYGAKGDDLVIENVADDGGWQSVKTALLSQVGLGSFPVIRIEDADAGGTRTLFLRHAHDGRDLEIEYARHALEHLHTLWGRKVLLETTVDGEPRTLGWGIEGFEDDGVVQKELAETG